MTFLSDKRINAPRIKKLINMLYNIYLTFVNTKVRLILIHEAKIMGWKNVSVLLPSVGGGLR